MYDDLPLISFCIPTYNRESYLLKSLDAIISQLDENSIKIIEILISDNASSDATIKVAQDYIKKNPDFNIRLISNSSNLGMDGNFISCYKNATGKYVCLVSDDDFLLPGKVVYLLNTLDLHFNIDGVFLNPFPIGGCLQEAEKLCFDPNEMLERVGNRLVHLGALVFKREIFLKKQYEKYNGSYLVISYIFLDVFKNSGGVYFTREKFFEITQNNSGGYNFFDVFVSSYSDLMDHALKLGFSQRVVEKMKMQHLRNFIIPFVVDLRLNNSYKRMKRSFGEGFYLIIKRYGLKSTVIFGVFPALFAPRFFWVCVRAVVRLNRKIFR